MASTPEGYGPRTTNNQACSRPRHLGLGHNVLLCRGAACRTNHLPGAEELWMDAQRLDLTALVEQIRGRLADAHVQCLRDGRPRAGWFIKISMRIEVMPLRSPPQ